MQGTHEPAAASAHLMAAAMYSPRDGDRASLRFVEAERSLLRIASISAAEPGARQLTWVRKLHVYEQFAQQRRRTPRENTRNREALPDEERRLGEWARYQRRRHERLCGFQRARLDVSPAFEWDPQQAGWELQLDACVRHAAWTGRLPVLNAADPIEFASARWLGRQLSQLKTGHLLPNRADRIKDLLDTFANH